jgi:S1-C subfamily serine protease
MAQRFQCPKCAATFTSKNSEVAEGAKIRCPKCAVIFRARAEADEADEREDEPRERSDRRQRAANEERSRSERATSRNRERDRDDDDDRLSADKRRKAKKKSGPFSVRNIIIVVAFAGAAVGAVIYLDQREGSKSSEQKKEKPEEFKPVPLEEVQNSPKWAPKGGIPPGFAAQRGRLPAVDPIQRLVLREPHVPASALDPMMKEDDDPAPLPKDLEPATIDRVKKATVYVRVRTAENHDVTGTGFFEAKSGLVITNAHVIDMLRGSEPPKQIEAILHSGEGGKKERVLMADVIAVDRESDVAVLRPRVQGASASLPQGLVIAPSSRINLLQPVFVFGFPLGEGLGKDITASATSVSSLRRDSDGNLSQVQVNGGMHSGNSGGPVVNTKGQVIGVAVAVIKGTQINFAIPGDRVQDLLRGRMDRLEIRDDPPRGTDIPVKFRLHANDPLNRIAKSGVDWWLGSPDLEVPASLETGVKLPENLTKKTVNLNYPGSGKISEGEIVLSPAPLAGQVLWMQPWTTSKSGLTIYAAGLKHAVDVPPDQQPITLRYAPPSGSQPLELTSTASFRIDGPLDDERLLRLNLTSKLHEETRERRPMGTTVTRFAVDKIDINVAFDERQAPPSAAIQRVTQHMNAVELFAETDASGGHVLSRKNVDKVPADSRESINHFCDQLQQSLQVMMVSLPEGQLVPGKTWKAASVVPGTGLSAFDGSQMQLEFKYLGVRPAINGKKLAVISLTDADDGTHARGKILVDAATGRVMQGRFEIATAPRLLNEVGLPASGVIDIQLTRLRD